MQLCAQALFRMGISMLGISRVPPMDRNSTKLDTPVSHERASGANQQLFPRIRLTKASIEPERIDIRVYT